MSRIAVSKLVMFSAGEPARQVLPLVVCALLLLWRFRSRLRASLSAIMITGLPLWCSAVTLAHAQVRPEQPNIRWGGRAVAAAQHPTRPSVAIIASATGGLFQTFDGGTTWSHVDSLAPFRMVDVKYAPPDGNVLLVSTLRDTRVANGGGILRSTDGGRTWARPAGADPADSSDCPAGIHETYAISFAPDSQDVYVATSCGIAFSRNLGETWRHTPINRVTPQTLLYSLSAGRDGVVYICGNRGIQRSADRASSFPFPPIQADRTPNSDCRGFFALAASHTDPNTVYVVAGRYASPTPGGGTCLLVRPWNVNFYGPGSVAAGLSTESCSARSPWIASMPMRDGNRSLLFWGNGFNVIERFNCSVAAGTTASSCGDRTAVSADHLDNNGITFDLTNERPAFLVTDGGAHSSTDGGFNFRTSGSSGNGFHALQIYRITGQLRYPDWSSHLYFGTQDNYFWASDSHGAAWPVFRGIEGGQIQLPEVRPTPDPDLMTRWDYSDQVFRRNPVHQSRYLYDADAAWTAPGMPVVAPVLLGPGEHIHIAQADPSNPLLTSVFYRATPDGAWTRILDIPLAVTGPPQVSGPRDNPTLFIPVRAVTTFLLRVDGIRTGSVRATVIDGIDIASYYQDFETFPVFAVDPRNPDRIFIADRGSQTVKVRSRGPDGRLLWRDDAAFTRAVTNGGIFRFIDHNNNSQLHAIAFDRFSVNRIVAGTEASGLILSLDNGATWDRVEDTQRVTAVSSIFVNSPESALVATFGRGIWRLRWPTVRPPVLPGQDFDVFLNGEIRDRYEGSVIIDLRQFFDPDFCTICMYVITPDGARVAGIVTNSKDEVETIVVSGKAQVYDNFWKNIEAPFRLEFREGAQDELGACLACQDLVKRGAAIRGLVLEGKKLKA
ncbi:MAG: hypothetical protein ACRD8O_14300, partial [Bryobacteraceae bacterium]